MMTSFGPALALASLGLAASLNVSLEIIPGSVKRIVGADDAGSAGNKYGFEDGSVVRVNGTTHLFVSELYTDPRWIGMRLAHWATADEGVSGVPADLRGEILTFRLDVLLAIVVAVVRRPGYDRRQRRRAHLRVAAGRTERPTPRW